MALVPSGDGIDHAWGGNHIVLGCAVGGGQIYVQYPSLTLANRTSGGSIDPSSPGHDLTGNGTLIPTLSVDQYMQRLARWLLTGVVNSNDPTWQPQGSNWTTVLPNWGSFSSITAQAANLNGFMGA